MTEEELVRGCIKENKSHQKILYQRFAGRMLGVCIRYTRHRQEAEDVLQEGFIKVFDHISDFGFKGSLEGWIRKIMVNTALKNFKKGMFRNEDIGAEDKDTRLSDPDAVNKLNEKDLLALIESLPEGYKVVFNLYAIEGFSHKEISEMLGINEGTSRSQLVKARKYLQKKLNQIESIRL